MDGHHTWIQNAKETSLIMALCDNLAATTSLAHRKLSHRWGSHMDRTVCNFQELSKRLPILMRWCPAHHDGRMQNTLAFLNKQADATAKHARKHKQGQCCDMPTAWSRGHTFAWYWEGKRAMGIK